MKILIGLITSFQGTVQIGGCQIPKQREAAHKLLGYLPQSVAFQEWRTVNQALKTFGKLSGLSDSELEVRIPRILEAAGLPDVRHKKISQLSGGMTQKVGLAQALLHEPKLLVLDEPLGGLDPLSRQQFKQIVVNLAKKGTTVLFSSHILSDVQDVANRIGILSRGKIKQVGTLRELKTHLHPQKTILVALAAASDRWQELGTIHGVKSLEEPSRGNIYLNLEADTDADEVTNTVVQNIVKLDIRIRSIGMVEPSLDEIYSSYVRESETA